MSAATSKKNHWRAGFFVSHTLEQLLDAIDERTAEFREDQGVDPVHDLRVSVRRLRALLSFLNPLVRSKVEQARGDIRVQALPLGRLRDVDVFLEHMAEGKAPVRVRDAAELRRSLVERRQELAQDVLGQLPTREWTQPFDTIRKAVRKQSWRGPEHRRAQKFCVDRLDDWWKSWLKNSRDVESLSFHALHQVRIRAKKLRYACEVSAELFWPDSQSAAAIIEGFKQFQDELGAVNDIATARAIVVDEGFQLPEGFEHQVDLSTADALRADMIAVGRFWRDEKST